MKKLLFCVILCLSFNVLGFNVSKIESMRRGAYVFKEYCAGCHALKYVSYERMLEDLKLDEIQFTPFVVKDIFTPALINKDALRWFGKVPPDLSLTARSRGTRWMKDYLRGFYADPTTPFGVNNIIFPQVKMPHVLAALQEQCSNSQEYQQLIEDLVNFMAYAAEPVQLIRVKTGIFVMMLLSLIGLWIWFFVRNSR
jgi:ubiquinol-cytochrome c reductase cytochrome c1 subunit